MKVAALGRLSLGAISDTELVEANSKLERISKIVGDQLAALDDARRAGMPQDLISELSVERQNQIARIQELSSRLDFINENDFRVWLSDARKLEAEAESHVARIQNSLSSSGVAPTKVGISIAAVVGFGVVGLGLVWLWRKAMK